jgi:fucose 4-O-acetylase-like acetyltransferase
MARERDAYLDNAKLLLIFLVITGHLLNRYRTDHPALFDLYNAIYLVHIPAFALISGYFARPLRSWSRLGSLARRLLVPFVVLQTAYTVLLVSLGQQPLSFELAVIYPQFTLWYLLSLFCWYGLLTGLTTLQGWLQRRLPRPQLRRLPRLESPVVALGLAISVGVAAGTIPLIGTRLSLCRTFVFFPFFLLGHLLERRHLVQLQTPGARLLGAGVLVGFLAYVQAIMPVQVEDWLFGSSSYADLGTTAALGSAMRLALYPLSLIGVLALLALVPTRRLRLTPLGSRTLYIFGLHGFGVELFVNRGLLDSWMAQGHYWLLPALAAAAVALLGNAAAISVARPVMELRLPASLRPLRALRRLAHGPKRAADPRSAEPRSADARSAGARWAGPRSAEPHPANARSADARSDQPQAARPQAARPQAARPQAARPQAGWTGSSWSRASWSGATWSDPESSWSRSR